MGGWVYILRCADGKYYTGSTSYEDIDIRVAEHQDGIGSVFTAERRPVMLVYSVWYPNLVDAHARERQIKGWSRAKKQALIADIPEALPGLSRRKPTRT